MLMRDLKYIDKLPTDTIILQENGVAAQKNGKGWEFTGCTGTNPSYALRLPIRVVDIPILKQAATVESLNAQATGSTVWDTSRDEWTKRSSGMWDYSTGVLIVSPEVLLADFGPIMERTDG